MEAGLDEVRLEYVDTVEKAMALKRWLGERREGPVGVDIETTGLSPFEPGAAIRLFQVGDMHTGWAMSWELWQGLALEVLRDWEGEFVGHNFTAFDIKWIERHSPYRFPRHRLHDTMLAAHIIDPLGPGGLKPLSTRLIDPRAAVGQRLLDEAMHKNKWTWATVPVDFPAYSQYGSLDPVLSCRLHDIFQRRVGPGTNWARVYELELAVRHICTRMEQRGMRLDVEYADRKSRELLGYAEQLREWCKANYGVSISSAAQLTKVFQGMGAHFDVYSAKTGAPSTDKFQLAIFANGDDPEAAQLAQVVINFRKALRFGGDYLQKFGNLAVSDADGDIVHPSIRTLGARTSRMSVSDPPLQQCVDGETEVLTPGGWVRFDALGEGTPVAQYHSDGSMEFVVPERVIRQPYSGDMVALTLWGREFVYTPDHRVVSFTRGRKGLEDQPCIDEATIWAARLAAGRRFDRRFARAGTVVGGRVLTDDERKSLQLAVIAQADGNFRTDMADDAYEVCVTKQRKIDALKSCGLPVRVTGDESSRPRHRTWISRSDVSEWLDGTKEKNFLPTVLSLCAEDLRWFIEEVMFWDGDATRRQSWSQSVKRRASINIVQAAAALSGYSTSTFYRNEGDGALQLNINRKPRRAYGAADGRCGSRTLSSDGMVYCVTVPSGMFMTRRQGLPIVTGNCPKNDTTIRRAFIPRDGNVIVATDFAQIEMRLLAHFSKDADLQQAFRQADETGGDFFVEVGKGVYNDPGFQKADKRRGLVKSVCYGLAYGAGTAKMAETAGVPIDQMKAAVDALTARYPGIRSFMKKVEDLGVRRERSTGQGYIVTPYGRRLPCDEGKAYTLTNYCLSPRTPILKADLTYAPAEQIAVGDRLVGFDEETAANTAPRPDGRIHKVRRMRTAVVEAVTRVRKPTLRITVSDGRTLECSNDHLWLVQHHTKTLPRTRWARADALFVGSVLHSLGMPWTTDTSRGAGWLAGLYDGDGSLTIGVTGGRGCSLSFSQLPGAVMDDFRREMGARGLHFRYQPASLRSTSPTDICVITGISNIMRVLGTLQPVRFAPKFESVYDGVALTGGVTEYVTVTGIEHVGETELVSIQTSTRTLIADGILSHNCLQGHAAEYFKQSLVNLDAAGWGEVMLLPVHDEIVMDLPAEDAAQALHDVPKIMENLTDYGVSMLAESDGPFVAWGGFRA